MNNDLNWSVELVTKEFAKLRKMGWQHISWKLVINGEPSTENATAVSIIEEPYITNVHILFDPEFAQYSQVTDLVLNHCLFYINPELKDRPIKGFASMDDYYLRTVRGF